MRQSNSLLIDAGMWASLACLWVCASCQSTQGRAERVTATERRPNLILFLVDDLGWQDSSVSMQGVPSAWQARYHTPNLEALADRGVRFSNAYASAPVCTPTRTAILTGQSPARTHITYWTLQRDQDTSRDREDLEAPAWEVNGLQPGPSETLPEILRAVGYRTIHVGKAHFGAHGTDGADPRKLGFDINIAGHASGAPGSYLGQHHFSASARQGKPPRDPLSPWDVPGLEKYHGQDIFLTEALALEASAAMRNAAQQGVPFFLNFAPYAVHTPIMANPRHAGRYDDLDPQERAYASMVATYDAALGQLVATLEETGQLEHTIIVFHSDNGGLSAHGRGPAIDEEQKHGHNSPLRSGKGSAFEGGTRVPLIVAWPGQTDLAENVGAIIDTPVISHDLFPTLIAFAGLQADYGPEVDGRDLTTLITGRAALFSRAAPLLWNQPHQWGAQGPGIEPFTSLRAGAWKLIYFHSKGRFHLYNLEQDPGEQSNRIASNPRRARELARMMDREIQRRDAQLSIDKTTGEPIAPPSTALEGYLKKLPH